jgi:hypothetical protein
MKIGGMGYAILRTTAEQLRELHTIPAEVVFVCTVEGCTKVWAAMVPEAWYHDEHPFYFRIQHRYLPRVHDRGPLMVFTLGELQQQFRDCAAQEKEGKGKPVPSEAFGPWVSDDA